MSRQKIINLYKAVNEMMAVLGAKGEINTLHEKTTNVMDALHELDEGVYDLDSFTIKVNTLRLEDLEEPRERTLTDGRIKDTLTGFVRSKH